MIAPVYKLKYFYIMHFLVVWYGTITRFNFVLLLLCSIFFFLGLQVYKSIFIPFWMFPYSLTASAY